MEFTRLRIRSGYSLELLCREICRSGTVKASVVRPSIQYGEEQPRPDANAKELFLRLQGRMAGAFAPGQLRTLQRRVKQWRSEIARQLVLGLRKPRSD